MPPPMPATLPPSFLRRKALILSQLSVPADQYDDLSPKGSVDEGIRGLIEGINAGEGWVTTSSCAGRMSVFVEGEKRVRVGMVAGAVGQGDGERDLGRVAGEAKGGGERDESGGGEEYDGGGGGGGKEEQDEEEDGQVEHETELDEGERTGRDRVRLAGTGGKGGGGRWLFVSHEPVDMNTAKAKGCSSFLGLQRIGEGRESGRQFTEERLIHFKFEPMVSTFFVILCVHVLFCGFIQALVLYFLL
jgi:tRNA wybutosine-synthesizing protein 3